MRKGVIELCLPLADVQMGGKQGLSKTKLEGVKTAEGSLLYLPQGKT